jgi:hypothetical protein
MLFEAKYLIRAIETHWAALKRIECYSVPGNMELTLVVPNEVAAQFKRGGCIAIQVEESNLPPVPEPETPSKSKSK